MVCTFQSKPIWKSMTQTNDSYSANHANSVVVETISISKNVLQI